jgi:hypothetical protein
MGWRTETPAADCSLVEAAAARGGAKRARAAAARLPASLGFAALGGGMTEDAAAAAEGEIE